MGLWVYRFISFREIIQLDTVFREFSLWPVRAISLESLEKSPSIFLIKIVRRHAYACFVPKSPKRRLTLRIKKEMLRSGCT